MDAPRWPVVAASALATIAGLTLASMRLPDLFPHAEIVVPAAFAGLLGALLVLALPDRLLYGPLHLEMRAFAHRHDLSDERTALALSAFSQAYGRALRLRAIADDVEFRADVAEPLVRVIEGLRSIAARLDEEPGAVGEVQNIVIRSEPVEDAVRSFARLKAARGTSEADIARARDSVLQTLADFERGLSRVDRRTIDMLVANLDRSRAVTGTLLGGRRAPAQGQQEGETT